MTPSPTAPFGVPHLLTALFLCVGADRSAFIGRASPRRNLLQVASLTEISSIKTTEAVEEKQASAVHSASRNPLPSGWFGAFSQDESTFTTAGLGSSRDDPEWAVKYGREPSVESPYTNSEVFNSDWFHESLSGGRKAAWQTYPSVTSSIAGNRGAEENAWRHTASGLVQDYRPILEEGAVSPSHATWFDNSVAQLDGFSRKMQPGSNEGLGDGWKERSVNTTLTCKEIGCTARASLQLFDADKEDARLCSLSIHIHATDYDDDWSREHVEFWKVNGYLATRECNPRARGCNTTAERPLYPCINAFNVDKIVDSKGSLIVEGKNTKMVDECPYQGNLLSGVAMATCMVRHKKPIVLAAPVTTPHLFSMPDMFGEAILKCDKPGCTAETMVRFSPAIALNGGKCTMNITVHQTDFDDHLGLPEQIDFIQVEGTNIATAVQPGKNPCNNEYKGKTLTDADKIFVAVKSHDITELVTKSHPLGSLRVVGKISDQVDECGYKGNLLYGKVNVHCVPPAHFNAAPPLKQTTLLHAPKKLSAKAAKKASALLQKPCKRSV